jgi:hypothetical protein
VVVIVGAGGRMAVGVGVGVGAGVGTVSRHMAAPVLNIINLLRFSTNIFYFTES